MAKVPDNILVQTWIEVYQAAPNGVITTGFLEQFLIQRNLLSATKKIKPRKNKSTAELESNIHDSLSLPKKRGRKAKNVVEDDTGNYEYAHSSYVPSASLPTAPQTPQVVTTDVMAAASDIMQIVDIFLMLLDGTNTPEKTFII